MYVEFRGMYSRSLWQSSTAAVLCCVESAGVFIATFNITSDKSHM